MKKFLILLICAICLCGCKQEDNSVDDKYYQQYQQYEEKLNDNDTFEIAVSDFSIRLIVNPTDDNQYRYDVIIDSPNVNMYYLQAIAKVEDDDSESLPTLGVLEENNYSLVPGVIDKENGIYKGINLSGITTKTKFSVYVYLTYYSSKESNQKIERYISLYGNATGQDAG